MSKPETNTHRRGTKDYRRQRAKDFANQNISKASDFDFSQYDPGEKKTGGKTHISGSEIAHLRKGTEGSLDDKIAALQAQKDAGAVFGKNAQKQFDNMQARQSRIAARKKAKAQQEQSSSEQSQGSTGQPTNAVDETQKADSDNVASNADMQQMNSTSVENTQSQEVSQDNDINTNVNGDNNTVITEQDNSIRQYGGDNRSFVYNHQGGSDSMATPVSAATMSGFYDVDDSPAAQAKFNDMYTTMNADNQKRYAGDAMKTYAKYGNIDARGYTPEAMETYIGRSIQDSYDKADEQMAHTFGDIWHPDYIHEDWKMPTPPKPIESNAGEIAEDAKEDVDEAAK